MTDGVKEEWLKERKTYLGGTDIAAICGTTPKWRTAYDVFLEKTSEQPAREINESMEIGTLLEPVCIELYKRRKGYSEFELRAASAPHKHKDHSFLAANIDCFITPNNEKRFILECKTAKLCMKKEWGEPGTSQIPIKYLIQVAWYSLLCEVERVDIALLMDNSFYIYEYKKNEELEKNLLKLGIHFWQNHVLKGIPPAPKTHNDLDLLYSDSIEEKIECDKNIRMECSILRDLKNKVDGFSKKIDDSSFNIKYFMKQNDVLVDSKGEILATWKKNKRNNRVFLLKNGGKDE